MNKEDYEPPKLTWEERIRYRSLWLMFFLIICIPCSVEHHGNSIDYYDISLMVAPPIILYCVSVLLRTPLLRFRAWAKRKAEQCKRVK